MEDLDIYICTRAVVPVKYYITIRTKVRGRKIYHFSNLVEKTNNKLILDNIIYDIEFPDGWIEE